MIDGINTITTPADNKVGCVPVGESTKWYKAVDTVCISGKYNNGK